MKSTDKLRLLLLLLLISTGARADVDGERIFRTITASDGLADNSAQTIKCTHTGRMTITTIGNINFYDGANFSHINTDDETTYKLNDYYGHYHLYFDNNHHLWLKSSSGVACVNLTMERYITNMDSLFATYGAKGKVGDMFVDLNGDVWLGDGKEMFCTKYANKFALMKGLNLQDLEVYDKKQLLMFYDDGLLVCYDLNSGKQLYQNKAYGQEDVEMYYRSGVQLMYENGFYMIRNGEVGAILMHYDIDRRLWDEVMRSDYHLNNMVVHDGKLYIASEWGFFTYDLTSGEIHHYKGLTLTNGRKLETDINVIEFDLQGGMWLGTEKRGLLYGSPVNAHFRSLTWDNPKALEYEAMMRHLTGISEFRGKKANVMLIDSRQWTWVGTLNGLYLYTTPKADPIVISRRNGLMNNVIHGLVEDDMNNIWVSTSYGIACVNIKGDKVNQVYCFTGSDNVPNETFFDAKAMKMPSGEIVMQAIDHVVVFNPKDFQQLFNQEASQMRLKLTKLLVNGVDVSAGEKLDGDIILDKAITRVDEINLNYDQNSISMTFSALNYARPLQTYYRVRIREMKNEWTEYSYFSGKGLVDKRGLFHLPLTGLQPGVYHIEMMASVEQGVFVGKPYEWVVNVSQPWWRTTGVMFLLGFLVLALMVLNFYVYNRNTRMKMRRNSEESDVIRRIVAFVSRCDGFSSEQLSPTQEEIYGIENEMQAELSNEFVDAMLKIIPFVHEREGRTITMHMLSHVTGLELGALYEMVSENLHRSPRVLIRSMRIDQVADQLLTTDKPIEDISTDCGFTSPNYMIANFFHKYRMTPAEYRQRR